MVVVVITNRSGWLLELLTELTNTSTNWCVMTSKVIKRCSDFVTQLTIHDILRNSKNNVQKIDLTVRK